MATSSVYGGVNENSFIGAGSKNCICASTASLDGNNTIVAGNCNRICLAVHNSFIGAGDLNYIRGIGCCNWTHGKVTKHNFIGAGCGNHIIDCLGATESNIIVGGHGNRICQCCSTNMCKWELGNYNFIGGGYFNGICTKPNSSGANGKCNRRNVIVGGNGNTIRNADASFIGGGSINVISGSGAEYFGT